MNEVNDQTDELDAENPVTIGSSDVTRLRRNCAVTIIPAGRPATLTEGDRVRIVQALGGSITVRTGNGSLMRVAARDADALGLPVPDELSTPEGSEPFEIERVIDALQSVYDPEIPVSIVELGLVYRCEELRGPDGTRVISIDMSMTAPGCGMGDVLRADAERVVGAVRGVDAVEVQVVWDPPWDLSRMSDEARLELGLF